MKIVQTVTAQQIIDLVLEQLKAKGMNISVISALVTVTDDDEMQSTFKGTQEVGKVEIEI